VEYTRRDYTPKRRGGRRSTRSRAGSAVGRLARATHPLVVTDISDTIKRAIANFAGTAEDLAARIEGLDGEQLADEMAQEISRALMQLPERAGLEQVGLISEDVDDVPGEWWFRYPDEAADGHFNIEPVYRLTSEPSELHQAGLEAAVSAAWDVGAVVLEPQVASAAMRAYLAALVGSPRPVPAI